MTKATNAKNANDAPTEPRKVTTKKLDGGLKRIDR